MQHQIDTITDALAQALAGEPAPAFDTADFRETVKAIGVLTNPAFGPTPHGHHMQALVGRMRASMQSERALAVMRDNGQNLC